MCHPNYDNGEKRTMKRIELPEEEGIRILEVGENYKSWGIFWKWIPSNKKDKSKSRKRASRKNKKTSQNQTLQ